MISKLRGRARILQLRAWWPDPLHNPHRLCVAIPASTFTAKADEICSNSKGSRPRDPNGLPRPYTYSGSCIASKDGKARTCSSIILFRCHESSTSWFSGILQTHQPFRLLHLVQTMWPRTVATRASQNRQSEEGRFHACRSYASRAECKCPRHPPRHPPMRSPRKLYCFWSPQKSGTDTLPATEAYIGPSCIFVIARSLCEHTKTNRSNSTHDQSSRHVCRGSGHNARSCRKCRWPLGFDITAEFSKGK